MHAVFENGSHQYKVIEGQVVRVDYRDADEGAQVEFPHVLLYRNGDDIRIGQPLVEGMRVIAEIVDHPTEKVLIQHFRRRKNYRRLRGHRQKYTSVRIKHILLPGQDVPSQQQPATTPTPPASETPAQQPPATPPATEPAAQQPPAPPSSETPPAS
jgi:large subunit ribosomal protein L21